MSLAKMWKPNHLSINENQLRGLLNQCLARFGFLGEVGSAPRGSKCSVADAQCNWAKRCLDNEDCSSPPLQQTMALVQAQEKQTKLDEEPDKIIKDEPAGVWVDGCEQCNLAMLMAWLGQNNFDCKICPKKKPEYSFLWDSVVPAILKFELPGPNPTLNQHSKSKFGLEVAKSVNAAAAEAVAGGMEPATEAAEAKIPLYEEALEAKK